MRTPQKLSIYAKGTCDEHLLIKRALNNSSSRLSEFSSHFMIRGKSFDSDSQGPRVPHWHEESIYPVQHYTLAPSDLRGNNRFLACGGFKKRTWSAFLVGWQNEDIAAIHE